MFTLAKTSGGRTLADACEKMGAPMSEVLRQLEDIAQAPNAGDKVRDWQAASLTAIAAYIVDTHHFFTKQELARLEKLLDKVCSRHGENHPELAALRRAFQQIKLDLIPHMLKEEQVLFPYIARLEEAVGEGREPQPPFFVTVQNPVRMMMTEHDTAGELLLEMRRVTNNYTTPPDGCISYQTLYQGLAEFEVDLHQHIHLENNILFPRAIEMESAAEPAWQHAGQELGEHRCFGG